jgi:hypothetical protein
MDAFEGCVRMHLPGNGRERSAADTSDVCTAQGSFMPVLSNRLLCACLLLFGLSGCATVNDMAVGKDSGSVDTHSKSIVLMSLEVYRTDNSAFVPRPFVVKLQKPGADSKADRQNFKLHEDEDTIPQGDHKLYLVRMALEPGVYDLMDVEGFARVILLTNGMFQVPLLMRLNVTPNSVTYVGRVTATLRPRQEGEFRAGALFPLIDQAAAGLSNGTWDVAVSDPGQADIAAFRSLFPALQGVSISDQVLPPFDRVAVQKWWDGQQTESNVAGANAMPQAAPSSAPASAPQAMAAASPPAPVPDALAVAPPSAAPVPAAAVEVAAVSPPAPAVTSPALSPAVPQAVPLPPPVADIPAAAPAMPQPAPAAYEPPQAPAVTPPTAPVQVAAVIPPDNAGSAAVPPTLPAAAVASEPAPASPVPAAAAAAAPGAWTVCVWSSQDDTSADAVSSRLTSIGVPAQIVPVEIKGDIWYRVTAGSFADRGGAARYAQGRLVKMGYSKAWACPLQ